MTIKELWDKCLPGVKSKSAVKFDTAKGKRLAVDISAWLHQLCSRANSALLITCVPMHAN